MLTELSSLAPGDLWNGFAALSAIPRPSGQEAQAAAFIRAFARSKGLENLQDATGNVLVRKPASPGRENRKTVLLQAHLDMVPQQNAGTAFDFSTEGITPFVEGDWVKAKGTTLGADNGIGVAAIMAVLGSRDLAHPPLEALFTTGEEVGATGALRLSSRFLKADVLLNLDSEDDRQLTIGCAGSLGMAVKGTYAPAGLPENMQGYRLHVTGLTGGHSGVDIHKGRGNAIKLLNRLLFQAAETLQVHISTITGGNLRNAIPREATAHIAVPAHALQPLSELVLAQSGILQAEYALTDPALKILLEAAPLPAQCLPARLQKQLLRGLYTCPNGIYRMSPAITGLVQTSNNISRVQIKEGHYEIFCLSRSFQETELQDLAAAVRSAFAETGASVALSNAAPGWLPDPHSALVKLVGGIYGRTFQTAPVVSAIHAGLECGIIGAKYPHLEMVSFGPNIRGAHSPDEQVQISSVQKFWELLVQVLQAIPNKRGANASCSRR